MMGKAQGPVEMQKGLVAAAAAQAVALEPEAAAAAAGLGVVVVRAMPVKVTTTMTAEMAQWAYVEMEILMAAAVETAMLAAA